MQPEEIAGESPGSDQGGNQSGQGGGADGIPTPPAPENGAAPEAETTGTGGPKADGANEDSGGGQEDHIYPEDSGDDGGAIPEAKGKDRRISGQTFRAACIAAKGNRTLIAAATGLHRKSVTKRINSDPELKEKYGDADADAPTVPPAEMGVLNRNPDDLPAHVAVEIGQVDAADMAQYYTALKAYGVSDERINKLKSLDGLANNWATHVSISLRGHHQSYNGQLHNLAEVAENIKKKLDGVPGPDGKIVQLDAESYSYLAKVYVECVKEAGKGMGMMLTLTEALVRMIGAKNEVQTAKAVSGWGPMKKVRKAG